MRWEATQIGYESRLAKILEQWESTPYKLGDQRKGLGVDCIRFCCGVADELFGFTREKLELLPQDMSMNQPKTAFATMRKLKRLYSPLEVLSEEDGLQPGDILVTGPKNGGPGHLMFVGPQESTLWHAGTSKVVRTGLYVPAGQTYFRTLRFLDRDRWA